MTDRREGADADGPLRPPPEERSPAELLAFGVVNLDKPPGPSAHQVSAWVRDLAGVERAAHAGTLDPSVTGCLPVLTGDATRVARALLGPKEYVAVLELHRRAPEDLDAVIEAFEGPILQRPPRKSAVDRSPRVRRVYDMTAVESEPRRLLLRVDCESGTYVRKLCHLEADDDADPDNEEPLVACYTPDGAAVCLGRLVGHPDADEGTVVDLERGLVRSCG
ncbi:hypothetical protein BRD10_01865 [Halobacteriales archaeon SW_12_71_31]|nr:MAG: hypothetical protein BRD10_01865 [Halobacteriales archaeon SW_12_71_31]